VIMITERRPFSGAGLDHNTMPGCNEGTDRTRDQRDPVFLSRDLQRDTDIQLSFIACMFHRFRKGLQGLTREKLRKSHMGMFSNHAEMRIRYINVVILRVPSSSTERETIRAASGSGRSRMSSGHSTKHRKPEPRYSSIPMRRISSSVSSL